MPPPVEPTPNGEPPDSTDDWSDPDELAYDTALAGNETGLQEITPHEPGGTDFEVPPAPNQPGNTIVEGPDGTYIELDEFGVPLGEWKWCDDEEMWIFEEFPPLSEFPKTGVGNRQSLYLILICLSLAGTGVVIIRGRLNIGKRAK
jgi:hypothetical protein